MCVVILLLLYRFARSQRPAYQARGAQASRATWRFTHEASRLACILFAFNLTQTPTTRNRGAQKQPNVFEAKPLYPERVGFEDGVS